MKKEPEFRKVRAWTRKYVRNQVQALQAVKPEDVYKLIEHFRRCRRENRKVFVIGNGGSSCNAEHFVADMNTRASDKLRPRFAFHCLSSNTAWMTSVANDSVYEQVFAEQLKNLGDVGDTLLALSVSGNSRNLLRATDYANEYGLETIAIVGRDGEALGHQADFAIYVDDSHYGRVEDIEMSICHMTVYAFAEGIVEP